jgi:hypothetical protein
MKQRGLGFTWTRGIHFIIIFSVDPSVSVPEKFGGGNWNFEDFSDFKGQTGSMISFELRSLHAIVTHIINSLVAEF